MISLKREIKSNEEFLLKLEKQFNQTIITNPETLEDLFSDNYETRELTSQERYATLYQSVVRHIDLAIIKKLENISGEKVCEIINQRDQIKANYSNLENTVKSAPNNFDFVLSELLK